MPDAPGSLPNGSGTTRSPWMEGADFPRPEPLRKDVHCDVAVVGAGIAGLTAAYHAARHGLEVVVLDDGPPGMGETFRTTAHLASAVDDRIHRLEGWHGRRRAAAAVQAHAAAIDLLGETCRRESIECDYVRLDGLLVATDPSHRRELRKEEAAARRAGLEVEMLDSVPWGRFDGPALRFARQGRFHPRRYLDGLTRAVQETGGRIQTGAHVEATTEGEGKVHLAIAGGRTVTARHAVLATNPPVGVRNLFFVKMAAYRTYVVAAPIAKSQAPSALLWTTDDPYYYVRTQADPRDPRKTLLLVGGQDHRVGQDEDPAARIDGVAQWARDHFPGLGDPVFAWSGQVQETMDGLCFAGRMTNRRRTYVVTGDSGMGMTHGTIGGKLVADLLAGVDNPWAELFDPARVRLRAFGSHVPEDLKSTAPYARHLGAAEVASEDEVPVGEGRVLREGGKPVCVYRAEDGTVTRRAAVCVHLGCVVGWNDLEKSWDCPCHGSRYDAQGQLVSGPANGPLPEAQARVRIEREGRHPRPRRHADQERKTMRRRQRGRDPSTPGMEAP